MNSREHELRICATLCMYPDLADQVRDELTADMFSDARLGQVYGMLVVAAGGGVSFDGRYLNDYAHRYGVTHFDKNELLPYADQSARFGESPEYVARVYRRRTLQQQATELLDLLGDDEVSDEALEQQVADMRGVASPGLAAVDVRQVAADLADEMRNSETEARIYTGFEALDDLTNGMGRSELVAIGARTSVGKTAFALQAAGQIADSRPVVFVSLEMSSRQVAQRLVSLAESTPLGSIIRNEGTAIEAVERFAMGDNRNLRVIAGRRLTFEAVTRKLRAMHAIGLCDCAIIDYLQLLQAADTKLTRYDAVSMISAELKTLAIELDIPVVALAQLNRGAEGTTRKPQLSDFRESGAIEQDADQCWLLDRDRDEPTGTLQVAKNRSGRVADLETNFDGARCRFDISEGGF